ncbi:MAG: prolyl oligopeptidase family serine peptidase [Ignavibacteria bacterium]|nr:prolyl oligopeptidase family serine peptidase [Ignavibacteria bacterium]
MRKLYLTFAIMIFASFLIVGQTQPITKANYSLAAKFSPKKVDKMVFSTAVDPHWLKTSDKFWYSFETPTIKNYYIVDPARGSKKLLFDNVQMARKLTLLTKDPYDEKHLPITKIQFNKDETAFIFEVNSSQDEEDSTKTQKDKKEKKIFGFEFNINTQELKLIDDYQKKKEIPRWANISPDGEKIVFSKNYNLYWMDKENFEKAKKKEDDSTIVEHKITTDGIENYSYGEMTGGPENNVDKEKNKNKRKGAGVIWSQDSKFIALDRVDNRKVKDLWVINALSEPRPTLETYKYQMPGEAESPIEELMVINLTDTTYKQTKIKADKFKDQNLTIISATRLENTKDDDYRPNMWLSKTSDKLYFERISRDLKRLDICVADVSTGEVKTLISEEMNTYVESRKLGLVNNGEEYIHWSERDGWAHFYLYDKNGKLKNQITSGNFHCEDIVKIDEKNRVLYFVANMVEPNEDPYYTHLYRVNFDGSGFKLLTPGNFNHTASMNDSNKYIINNYSRVNTVPKSTLYDNTGKKIMDLEEADLSQLFAAGYKFPEPFVVKAADGITDIYGVMYKPFDFDSTKSYPLIEYVYPGPQTESVNKSFSKGMDRIDRLAQFGFVVVTLGNRGGHPSRSKWYHNYGYGNLRDYGLADKKYGAEQLADRYKFIDISRVGIHGHSGGGFMSTAAMLVYPDFFKVAVSSAGNHENNIYNRWWSEKHDGVKEVKDKKGEIKFEYDIDKNSELAKNLKGKLLLVTGDIDNNVHPGNTIRMSNALIKANKRFDFMIMPGQRHGFGDMTEYFFWLMGDYFCKHLLGDYSTNVDITEMNNEVEQTGNKKPR